MTYNVSNTDFKISSYPGISLLSRTAGIDGTSATTTNLCTVPTGRMVVVVMALVRPTTLTGFVTTATAGIGVAAGEADIFAAVALTGLSSTTVAYAFQQTALTFAVAQSTDVIKLGIDVGYVATTATLTVELIGYLI